MDYITLFDRLQEYDRQGLEPFHMPGHKRNCDKIPRIAPYRLDITEIDGFDDLHHADGCIKDAADRAAVLYGTVATHFLINGCTAGILAAVSACAKRGQGILMARNCHKAVYNAAMINNLRPYYVWPVSGDSAGNVGGSVCIDCAGSPGGSACIDSAGSDVWSRYIMPEDIECILSRNDDIGCVVITSPTYEGYVSDVEQISRIVHKYHIPLIVDEAHGAHFPWDDIFPVSAIECGADIVIHGIHKTLPSLTQTALLHVCSDRVSDADIQRYLSVYQSSSPSYLLMGSIDYCVDYLIRDGRKDYDVYAERLAGCYERLEGLDNLYVLPYGSNRDASKIVVCTDRVTIDGLECYNILRNRYNIQPEMVSREQVILMTSVWTREESFARLEEALLELDSELGTKAGSEADGDMRCELGTKVGSETDGDMRCGLVTKIVGYPHNEYAMPMNDAINASGTDVLLAKAEGKISRKMIYIYPPGIPIIVPGERVSKECVELLMDYSARGYDIRGLADSEAAMLSVVYE